jgi:hypothetical protein
VETGNVTFGSRVTSGTAHFPPAHGH